MTKFRPCIDLHNGQVKQIVGGTLTDDSKDVTTNFVSMHPPGYFADLYKKHNLLGSHVIKLGKGNDKAALDAIQTWHKGFQLGGGVDLSNCEYWLEQGADKVIVTSWLFPDARFDAERLRRMVERIGKRDLVIDLSCRAQNEEWVVAMNKWQTLTDCTLNQGIFD